MWSIGRCCHSFSAPCCHHGGQFLTPVLAFQGKLFKPVELDALWRSVSHTSFGIPREALSYCPGGHFIGTWPALQLPDMSEDAASFVRKSFLSSFVYPSCFTLLSLLPTFFFFSVDCLFILYLHLSGIACWLERRTRDREVASSNPGRSGGKIFFSRVNFVC